VKSYPSIPRRPKGKQAARRMHLFDKLDGANLRFEWSRQRGWFRWGTRHQVIDETHPVFGEGMPLFREHHADGIERVARAERWEAVVAFAELWGPGSLGGRYVPGEPKRLSLFDVSPHRRGLLGPVRFLELFGGHDGPAYLGEETWDDELVARVRAGAFPGVTFEGIVGKAGDGHALVMAKAKTEAWVQRILERYGEAEGRQLVDS
jgi:hypothetical protein